jgi:hypothetical protein
VLVVWSYAERIGTSDPSATPYKQFT